ncbi:MAG: phosphotransferase [Anaerolineae bacterium]|jgi:streptomycin 6-kinase|nr:phosphotransferase [Anaerolineae bacterium]MBT7075676.1 phosphotransferase [Anaerolineae bacterium]MBT7782100.1 phosphotransferase [Anaerolineae bacterium]
MINIPMRQLWSAKLPDLLEKYAAKWKLEILTPFENLSYNYAAPARRADGTLVVIKAGFPKCELDAEIAALGHFGGQNMVCIYECELDDGIFLLEKISPGKSLWNLDDKQSTNILLDLMPKLWRPYCGEYPFPTIADWGRGFSHLRERNAGGTGRLDKRLIDRAENIYTELVISSESAVLLHGDLHHGNVLLAKDKSYLAIDPKGVLGEPCYEVGAFLRNPMPELLKREKLHTLMMWRTKEIVEKLGFEQERVVGWAMSQAVLAAIWCDEDSLPCREGFMRIAEVFDSF